MTSSSGTCCQQYRILVVAVAFLAMLALSSNVNVISFTFICMSANQTRSQVEPIHFSQMDRSLILWASATGTLLAVFPLNYLYIKFGARWVLFGAGMLSAVSTASIPLAIHHNFYLLLFLRLLQGIGYAADFAAVGVVVSRWVPLSEVGLSIGVLTSFSPMSTVVSNPLSGWLCDSDYGWPSAFLLHGLATTAIMLAWVLIYNDDPHLHRAVGKREVERIYKDKTEQHIRRDDFVPYLAIVRDPVTQVVWINAAMEIFSGQLLAIYGPLYFKSVLGYDNRLTGLLTAVPMMCHMPCKITSGILSDRLPFKEVTKMRCFNTIALGMAGLSYIAISFVWLSWQAVFCAALVLACMGANAGGFYKCATITSRQYAHFVLANVQLTKCIQLFVGPAIVTMVVRDDTSRMQWAIVLVGHGVAMILSNLLFCLVCSAEPRPYTSLTRDTPTLAEVREAVVRKLSRKESNHKTSEQSGVTQIRISAPHHSSTNV